MTQFQKSTAGKPLNRLRYRETSAGVRVGSKADARSHKRDPAFAHKHAGPRLIGKPGLLAISAWSLLFLLANHARLYAAPRP